MESGLGPTTKSELKVEIEKLLLQAYFNGVDVDNGGYPFYHEDPEVPNWDLHLTRVVDGN